MGRTALPISAAWAMRQIRMCDAHNVGDGREVNGAVADIVVILTHARGQAAR